MSAFADYIALRLAVSEHVGNRDLSDVMDRFTQSAEAFLNRKIRHRRMLTDASLTFTAGRAPLPADFLEMEALYDDYGVRLSQTDLAKFRTTGTGADWYAVDDGEVLVNGRTSPMVCVYYAKLPTLTASLTTSNWLLEHYPNAYLYAVGMEAAKFLKNVDLVGNTEALLVAELRELKIDSDRARFGDATVSVEGPTP